MINLLADAVIASLGEFEHPDKDILNYIQVTADRRTEMGKTDFKFQLKQVMEATMWAGFSVSELIFEEYEGAWLLDDIVTYHPATITIRTDKQGRLIEGAPSYEGPHLLSGIYQNTNSQPEVKLPLWKVVYLTHDRQFNNFYGTSVIEGVYRWHVLKEAFVDMMTVTLDRYGNPMSVYLVPRITSGQVQTNPVTGEEVTLTTSQLLEQQLANSTSSMESTNLILEYVDPQLKPDVKVLSNSNNFSDSFERAIRYCEAQQIRNLLVPQGFVDSSATKVDTSASERQIEIFNRVITALYHNYVVPFINQTIYKAIKLNFDRPSAKQPPVLPLRKATRPEARVALMQMIKGLTEMGYFNPTSDVDWSMVREMVDCLQRPMSKEDIEFVKQLIIYPKQPDPAAPNKPSSTSSSTKKDRSTEGKIKGTGSPGRSTGVSVPLQNPRPKTKDSD